MIADVHEYEPDDRGACHVCGRGRGDLQHGEPEHVGGFIVQSDTFPGSWGWGPTEAEAVERWRANGGRGSRFVLTIDPAYCAAYVDQMGQTWADWAGPGTIPPRRERPALIARAERVGARGKRTPLDLDA